MINPELFKYVFYGIMIISLYYLYIKIDSVQYEYYKTLESNKNIINKQNDNIIILQHKLNKALTNRENDNLKNNIVDSKKPETNKSAPKLNELNIKLNQTPVVISKTGRNTIKPTNIAESSISQYPNPETTDVIKTFNNNNIDSVSNNVFNDLHLFKNNNKVTKTIEIERVTTSAGYSFDEADKINGDTTENEVDMQFNLNRQNFNNQPNTSSTTKQDLPSSVHSNDESSESVDLPVHELTDSDDNEQETNMSVNTLMRKKLAELQDMAKELGIEITNKTKKQLSLEIVENKN